MTDIASDDYALVKQARQGSKESFELLVKKHQNRICQTAYSFLHDYNASLDAAQETFMKAYKALDRFNPEFNFLTWLSRICVNHCLDMLRRARTAKTICTENMDLSPDTSTAPENVIDKKETSSRIMEIVQSMPANYRTVLILKDLQDLSFGEISEMLDINNSTLRWRLHMARKLFKSLWTQKEVIYGKH